MPFSPYGTRTEKASKLKRMDATRIVIDDQSLFWKGTGAMVEPKLNEDDVLEQLQVTSGGSGYSASVTARIVGAGSSHFKLGAVTARDGRIVAVSILKTGRWYNSSRMFLEGEALPFSGTAEIRYRNGQLLESRQYLEGELHGKCLKWKQNGIPLHEKDYVRGLKHGTHMYWRGEPIDPKNYKSEDEHSTYASLWMEVNELAKREFEGKYPSAASNEWVIQKYLRKGGGIAPKQLEHFEKNRLHGLCEGYDKHGDTIFKDEYESGNRIKHKTFDPGTKWKVPTKLSNWAG
ncbi:MAG: hypothetical protein VCA36_03795 [Opitutales bacterium]